MLVVYNLCKKLIEKKRTDGLLEKMDAYLANDRLTVEEYNNLVALLNQSK